MPDPIQVFKSQDVVEYRVIKRSKGAVVVELFFKEKGEVEISFRQEGDLPRIHIEVIPKEKVDLGKPLNLSSLDELYYEAVITAQTRGFLLGYVNPIIYSPDTKLENVYFQPDERIALVVGEEVLLLKEI